MKKQLFLLSFALGLAGSSYAQFSAGVMAGVGHLSQRQESLSPDYLYILGVDAVRPVGMAGVYGQYTTEGKRGGVAGLQLRYQEQRQTSGISSPLGLGSGLRRYNRYSYLVATPYVGIRPFSKLEIASGPEISWLLQSRLASIPFRRNPAQFITGYNIKATYWFGRVSLEGGYSRQITAFDSQQEPNAATFRFYNRYAYGVVKYNLIGSR